MSPRSHPDLESPTRLAILFIDAERRGHVRRCEADKLAFFAAAEHAKRVGTRNCCGLFTKIVRGRSYAFVAHEDEERARRSLMALRETGFAIPRTIPKRR